MYIDTTTLLIALGAAYGIRANSSTEGNNHAAVAIIGLATGVWVLCGTPQLFLEKDRVAKFPKGETYLEIKDLMLSHGFNSRCGIV